MNEKLKKLIEWLKANNGPQEMIDMLEKELKLVNPETVKAYLETDPEGQKLAKSFTDTVLTKGIKTFEENFMKEKLPGLIQEEVKKRHPEETPEQKRIREIEEKLQKTERDRSRQELLNKAQKIAAEKKLPLEIVPFLVGEDEAKTLENLNLLETAHSKAVQAVVDDTFKSNGRQPSKANSTDDIKPISTEEYLSGMFK